MALALVSLVAAGTALSQWLSAPVDTTMHPRTLVVVIAWGVAGLAAVALVPSHRRARHPDAADVK
jgi:hypothetical protein